MSERSFQFSFYKLSNEDGPEWPSENLEAFKEKLISLNKPHKYGLTIDEFQRKLVRRISRDQRKNFPDISNAQFDVLQYFFMGYYSIKFVPSGFGLFVRCRIQGERLYYILGLFRGPVSGNDPDGEYFPGVYNITD